MILEYYRPKTLDEALGLLSRTDVDTVPLGGGTVLNQPRTNPIDVVDLQSLGLNNIETKGKKIEIGATVTLQQLLGHSELPLALKQSIRHEATYNIRQVATVAGTIVAADGRSPFGAVILALAAELTILPGETTTEIGSFLPLRSESGAKSLITKVCISNHVSLSYKYVARSPADLPIVCVAVARWPSGRTRVALGGFGSAPILAMDGPEPDGAETAARDAYHEAGDQWASAEYRSNIAAILVKRCVQNDGESA